MKFQKGDLVQIVNHLSTRKSYAMHYTKQERKDLIDRVSHFPSDYMVEFKGQLATITDVSSEGYELDIVDGEVFTDMMLKRFEDRLSRRREIHVNAKKEIEELISHTDEIALKSLINKALDEKDEKLFKLLSERMKELIQK